MAANRNEYIEKCSKKLHEINDDLIRMPGLITEQHVNCFSHQIYDSVRRIEYIFHIRDAKHSPLRMDPQSELFDPLKASILHLQKGNIEEAYWLIFLAVHFGKHARNGWSLARKVYGRLGEDGIWGWAEISSGLDLFTDWLAKNYNAFSDEKFSNHRKYESLNAQSNAGTAAVFKSYVEWVQKFGGHVSMIRDIHQKIGQNPGDVFDYMYRSMDDVKRFGRLGRFDFLTMLGKLGIAPIHPDSAYLWHNATGPKKGARLLFGGAVDANISPTQLDENLRVLDSGLHIGMQALEDSMCNWQKSPNLYLYFRG